MAEEQEELTALITVLEKYREELEKRCNAQMSIIEAQAETIRLQKLYIAQLGTTLGEFRDRILKGSKEFDDFVNGL